MLAPWSLTVKLQELIHKTKKMEQTVLKCIEGKSCNLVPRWELFTNFMIIKHLMVPHCIWYTE
jgi:hypothetical protein